MSLIYNNGNIYCKKGENGIGVYCRFPIKKGELIELGIMYVINDVDGNYNEHLFSWSNDRRTWAAASGFIAFYNHSDEPNIKKVGNLVNNTMEIYALRDIEVDEELCNTYMSKKWRKCFSYF